MQDFVHQQYLGANRSLWRQKTRTLDLNPRPPYKPRALFVASKIPVPLQNPRPNLSRLPEWLLTLHYKGAVFSEFRVLGYRGLGVVGLTVQKGKGFQGCWVIMGLCRVRTRGCAVSSTLICSEITHLWLVGNGRMVVIVVISYKCHSLLTKGKPTVR